MLFSTVEIGKSSIVRKYGDLSSSTVREYDDCFWILPLDIFLPRKQLTIDERAYLHSIAV